MTPRRLSPEQRQALERMLYARLRWLGQLSSRARHVLGWKYDDPFVIACATAQQAIRDMLKHCR
jgi:hypothetical protein